jgi:hypothetical protein
MYRVTNPRRRNVVSIAQQNAPAPARYTASSANAAVRPPRSSAAERRMDP